MSNVVGGTDLQVMQVEPSQVGFTRYVTRVISFARLPHSSRAMSEEPGYEAITMFHPCFLYVCVYEDVCADVH